MATSNGPRSGRESRRAKVAHIRFSDAEFSALEEAADRARMSVSAFVRSLALEGAGVRPFLSHEDQAIMQLLSRDMRVIGNNLNQVARAINAGRAVNGSDLMGAIDDSRAVATTVAAELAAMTRSAAGARRGEAT